MLDSLSQVFEGTEQNANAGRDVLALFLCDAVFAEDMEAFWAAQLELGTMLEGPLSEVQRGELSTYHEFVTAALGPPNPQQPDSNPMSVDFILRAMQDGGDDDALMYSREEIITHNALLYRENQKSTAEFGRNQALLYIAHHALERVHNFSMLRQADMQPYWKHILKHVEELEDSAKTLNDYPTGEEIVANLELPREEAIRVIGYLSAAGYLGPEQRWYKKKDKIYIRRSYSLSPRGKDLLELMATNPRARIKAGIGAE